MNGKECCKTLKAIRKTIADANGIPYNPEECTHTGDCRGTCPACEAEVRYIEKQLDIRRLAGQSIKIVGLASSVLAMASCASNNANNQSESTSSEPKLEQTMMDDTVIVDWNDTIDTDSTKVIVIDDSFPPPPPPPPPLPFKDLPQLEGFVSHKYMDSIRKKEKETVVDSVKADSVPGSPEMNKDSTEME